MAKETQLLWAREEREALEKAIPGLSRRVTLARRVESLLVRVQDLLRERARWQRQRSEEHTSELQSQSNLVCRLLLEKKKITSNFDPKTLREAAQQAIQS